MTLSQLELVRRCVRLALMGLGTLFTLMCVRLTNRARSRTSQGTIFESSFFDDEVVFGILLFLAFAIVIGLAGYCAKNVRNPAPPRPSFWRTNMAMFMSVVVYLIGAGVLCGWMGEWSGDDEAALTFFITGALGVGSVSAFERGRLPALALLVGALGGGIASIARLSFGHRSYYIDEAIAFSVLALFLFPIAYLLIRGLLNLVAGRSEEQGGGVGFGLPLQVVAQDGTYLVTVEAPGLADASAVEARVAGSQLHLTVARPTESEGELLYSTRCSGRFPVVVELPQALQEPWNVSVEHGLVTVQVAPIGTD